jgi:hypothetical protein
VTKEARTRANELAKEVRARGESVVESIRKPSGKKSSGEAPSVS